VEPTPVQQKAGKETANSALPAAKASYALAGDTDDYNAGYGCTWEAQEVHTYEQLGRNLGRKGHVSGSSPSLALWQHCASFVGTSFACSIVR